MRTSSSKTRRDGGFTLVEVLIALAIIALTAAVLLDQRVEVVRDAGRARDARAAWVLASQKMAELELDKAIWVGQGGSASGDFGDRGSDYAEFTWESLVTRRPVPTNDPLKPEQKPKEIFHLALRVSAPGLEEPAVLEALFPVDPPKPAGREAPADPPAGTPPPEGNPSPATPPAPAPSGQPK
jgi:type II secretion system protein I